MIRAELLCEVWGVQGGQGGAAGPSAFTSCVCETDDQYSREAAMPAETLTALYV